MIVQNLSAQAPFVTKDGSTIRSILDRTNAPIQNQSLAEARVPAAGRTERHYHKVAEELYFILEGAGEIQLNAIAGQNMRSPLTKPRYSYPLIYYEARTIYGYSL